MKTVPCPICKGSGEMPEPYHHAKDEKAIRENMALTLHEAGFSLRQIAKALGYDSHRSVTLIIEKGR